MSAWSCPAPSPASRMSPASSSSWALRVRMTRARSSLRSEMTSSISALVHGFSPGSTGRSAGVTAPLRVLLGAFVAGAGEAGFVAVSAFVEGVAFLVVVVLVLVGVVFFTGVVFAAGALVAAVFAGAAFAAGGGFLAAGFFAVAAFFAAVLVAGAAFVAAPFLAGAAFVAAPF